MAAMKGRELRAEARISVKERAALKRAVILEDAWFPCMVQDMSDSGFLILCGKELAVSQLLDFRCELFPAKTLNCRIEVRHIGPAGIGTKVAAIDDRGRSLLKLYLEEQYSLKLNSKS
ncbi:MAG TPA: PilZ domain-containing protein [Burkholderiales bacterium]|jgi:hypothetical protein